MWMLYIESGKEYLKLEVKKLIELEERNVWVYEARIKFVRPRKTIFEFMSQELSLPSREKEYVRLGVKN